jgi:predicted RNA-binding protein YlxR (DUF448 family)
MVAKTERTCAICRTKKLKAESFRFLVNDSAGSPQEIKVIYDQDQKELGRGFYICSQKCWEDGVKKKRKIKISSRENKFIGLPEVAFDEIVKN